MQMFVPIIMYGVGLFFVVITKSTMFTNTPWSRTTRLCKVLLSYAC